MATGDEIRGQLIERLEDQGGHSYQAVLRGCTLIFPADSWANARQSGMSFTAVLLAMHAHAFEVLDGLIANSRLMGIRFSSLYRATGGGPHSDGRGIDIVALKDAEPAWIQVHRIGEEDEPRLVEDVRAWLWAHTLVSQVLGPWFMCNAGKGCSANKGQEELEKLHLTHMHVTVKP